MYARIIVSGALSALSAVGCCNMGCRYDLRKYPTPLVFGGTGTLVNADNPCADNFGRFVPPGYSLGAQSVPTLAPSQTVPLFQQPVPAVSGSPIMPQTAK